MRLVNYISLQTELFEKYFAELEILQKALKVLRNKQTKIKPYF